MPDATIASIIAEVVARRGVGFRHGAHALAEKIERRRARPAASTARAASIASVDGLAGDEPAREAAGPASHAVARRELSSGLALPREERGKNGLATSASASISERAESEGASDEQVLDRAGA